MRYRVEVPKGVAISAGHVENDMADTGQISFTGDVNHGETKDCWVVEFGTDIPEPDLREALVRAGLSGYKLKRENSA